MLLSTSCKFQSSYKLSCSPKWTTVIKFPEISLIMTINLRYIMIKYAISMPYFMCHFFFHLRGWQGVSYASIKETNFPREAIRKSTCRKLFLQLYAIQNDYVFRCSCIINCLKLKGHSQSSLKMMKNISP